MKDSELYIAMCKAMRPLDIRGLTHHLFRAGDRVHIPDPAIMEADETTAVVEVKLKSIFLERFPPMLEPFKDADLVWIPALEQLRALGMARRLNDTTFQYFSKQTKFSGIKEQWLAHLMGSGWGYCWKSGEWKHREQKA